jgi:hypothetical protein
MIFKFLYKFVGVSYFEFKTSNEFGQIEYSAFKTERGACTGDERVGPFNAYVLFGNLKRNRRLYMNGVGETPRMAVSGWVLLQKSNYSCYAIKLSPTSKILDIVPCTTQYNLT